MRAFYTAASLIVVTLAGCGGSSDSAKSIVGGWEQVSFRARGATPPVSKDDADPVSFIQATFRNDGYFTGRYEQEGTVTSVVGTWKQAENRDGFFVLRVAMIDGKPVPREARDHGVEVAIDDHSYLHFPYGIDAATGRFRENYSGLGLRRQ